MKNNNFLPIVYVVGGLFLFSKITSVFASPRDTQRQATRSELDKLANQGVIPTKSDTNFNELANQIERALTGFGEDEDAIYHVMDQLQNEADVLKLIQAFGERRLLIRTMTLGEWLTDALSPDELSTVNLILAQNNIPYRF